MKKRIIAILCIVLGLAIITGSILAFWVYLPKKREKEEQMRKVQEYYDSKLKLYSEENDRYSDYEVDVAFLGDSLTDGYDLKRYYPEYTVANRGIGGETTHGLEKRLEISLYELRPKVAVILIGGNNLNTMLENYEDMLVDIKANVPDTKIILCSLTSMGKSWAEKNKIATYNNVVIKKLAEKHGFDFVDLYTPLFDEETGEIYADFTSDGAHLTSSGYEVMTEAITPAINRALYGS